MAQAIDARGADSSKASDVIRWLVVITLHLTACTTLTPDQEGHLPAVKAFLGTVARTYKVPTPYLVVGETVTGEAGYYKQGTIFIQPTVLTSASRWQILAHEMAHYVLGHGGVQMGLGPQEVQERAERREHEAHVKAVEILARAMRWDERQAFDVYLVYLRRVEQSAIRTGGVTRGHKHTTAEISDFLAAFPQFSDAAKK